MRPREQVLESLRADRTGQSVPPFDLADLEVQLDIRDLLERVTKLLLDIAAKLPKPA